jgi:mRNA interferase MazF
MFKRGGIYSVCLAHDEERGKETCPCLVVSNNVSNEFSPVVTIVPLSFSNLEKIYEFETLLPAANNGLGKDAKISSHIIITIDKAKVVGERLGFLTKTLLARVDKTLRFQLDL